MSEFKVTIKQRHFKKATSYMDPKGCPLYHALKEIFPNVRLGVGRDNVDIAEFEDISFNTSSWGRNFETIYANIMRAHNGEPITEEYTVVFPDFPQELLDTINQEVVS